MAMLLSGLEDRLSRLRRWHNRTVWKDLVRWSAAKRRDDGTWSWIDNDDVGDGDDEDDDGDDDDGDEDDIRYLKHFLKL